jgi:hypothetical protein
MRNSDGQCVTVVALGQVLWYKEEIDILKALASISVIISRSLPSAVTDHFISVNLKRRAHFYHTHGEKFGRPSYEETTYSRSLLLFENHRIIFF